MSFIGRSQDFGFVDVIHAQLLKYLGFRKMADAALGHYRYGNRGHDLANFFGRGHARHATLGANLRRNPLQRHDRYCSGLFSNHRLLGVGDVHDDAAFEHFCQAGFQPQAG